MAGGSGKQRGNSRASARIPQTASPVERSKAAIQNAENAAVFTGTTGANVQALANKFGITLEADPEQQQVKKNNEPCNIAAAGGICFEGSCKFKHDGVFDPVVFAKHKKSSELEGLVMKSHPDMLQHGSISLR
eukprot:6250994-Amphidinium_carterae.1